MARTKNYRRKDFKLLTKEQISNQMEIEVFSNEDFKSHVRETSENLDIDIEIVKDVLIHYFTMISNIINTVRKIKTKVNIYGFLSIEIKKGKKF